MGVCASDSRLGLRALRDWCQAMDLEYVMPDCKVWQADILEQRSWKERTGRATLEQHR
jgi:hypothetical protein